MAGEVAIIGVGTQGSMIAFRNAVYGKRVVGYSRTRSSLEACRSKIDTWLDWYVTGKRLTREEADAARRRVRYAATLEDACRNAGMVIENVPEVLELKREVFAALDALCPPHALLSSNTSSLLMSEICEALSPERKKRTFQVDHDDPVRNDYLEIMWNAFTGEETKKAALAHYRELGFAPLVTEREIKGYSVNRVWRAVKRECLYLWANGYTDPAGFDRAWMQEWHAPLGPFRMMDLIGLDTIWNIENSYYAASGDERDKPPARLRQMLDEGRLGMKSGRGFYEGYDPESGNLSVQTPAER